MITARHGVVSFQYLLEQEAQSTSPNLIDTHQVQRVHVDILTVENLKTLEIQNLKNAVQHCDGKIFGEDGAAHLLGMNPTTLISRLKKYEIHY